MTQVPLPPPPQTGQPIDSWLYLLWRRLTQAGQILWSSITPGTSADVAAVVTDETGSPGSLVFSGNPTLSGITDSGNLVFTGTGNRITGDFSNATVSSRVGFQTSTVNGNTIISVLPNGSATISQFQTHNSSDIDNAAFFQMSASASNIQLLASKRGTGTYLPFLFFTGGVEQIRVAIDGTITLGGTSTLPAFKVVPVASQARWIEVTGATSSANPQIATTAGDLLFPQNIVIPKTSGKGIQVDTAAPTFGWRDILGKVTVKAIGANDPVWSVFRGSIYAYKCSNAIMNETWQDFHIPHDYVPGTDLYIHVHWAQNTVDTGGTAGVPGAAKWSFDLSYAKGHGTAGGAASAFSATILQSVTQQAPTTQYGHMIAEVAFTSAGGDATHIDNALIEPDGIVLCRTFRDAADAADTLNQNPFLLFVDIHYQSTNIGTKQKSPSFYT